MPMRVVKKILKWAFRAVLIVVGILVLLSFLVFLPPVQSFIKNKAAAYVSQNMGFDLEIERLRLRFPLTLAVDNTLISLPQGDTILHIGELRARVAVMPLFAGHVEVRSFRLENAAVNYTDSLGTIALRGSVEHVRLRNTKVKLNDGSISIGGVSLADAALHLDLGESPDTDSVAAEQDTIPWRIEIDKMELERVAFTMHTSPEVTVLKAWLNEGRVDELGVDLARQTIDVKRIGLGKGDYSYLTDTVAVQPVADSVPVVVQPPWTVRIGHAEVDESSVAYGSLYGEPAAGFDPEHIRLRGLNMRVDSVYNRGGDISAHIRSLQFGERSGIEVASAQGGFAMDSSGMRINDLNLQTPGSRIVADAFVGAGIFDMSPDTGFSIVLDASLASSDIMLLYPADGEMVQLLQGRTVTLKGEMYGTLDEINIRALDVAAAPDMSLSADGVVRSAMDVDNLSGDVRLEGNFRNAALLTALLPEELRGRIGFPESMGIRAAVVFDRDNYTPDIALTADGGELDVIGTVNLRAQTYDVSVRASGFPLHSFLPADSLGLATFRLTAAGRGFDLGSEDKNADIAFDIERFDYLGFNHHGISLEARLADNKLTGTLRSANEALKLDVDVAGTLGAELYTAQLKGRLDLLDLQRMRLTDTPMTVSGKFDVSASSAADISQMTYGLYAAFDSLSFSHSNHLDLIPRTVVNLSTSPNKVRAELRSGDLSLDFRSSLSLPELSEGFIKAADTLMRQVSERDIDFRLVNAVIPAFNLDMKIGRNNIAHSILKEDGYDFNKITVASSRTDTTDFRFRGLSNGFRTSNLALDTLSVNFGLREGRLAYFVRLANKPGNIEQLALIYLYGSVAGDSIQTNISQRNREGERGFTFGVNTRLRDSSLRMNLYPQNPVFAYDTWKVNPDNFIEYRFNQEIYANLRLENQTNTGHLNILSANVPDMPPGSVRLDIADLDIAKLLDLFPTFPPLGGIFSSNIVFGMEDPLIAANGSLQVEGFTYDRRRVGDLKLDAATTSDDSGLWNINAGLSINQKQALTVRGTYNMPDGAMNIRLAVPNMPLTALDAFMPANTVSFAGELHGDIRLTGTADNPDLSGTLDFEDSRITVAMIGTTFGISAEPVRITRDRIRLRGFGLIAPNNQLLSMDGTIDFGDLSRITTDLTVSGRNFQAVNAPRNRGSQIYGVAAVNAEMTVSGLIEALVLRGRLEILRSTDVVYTMRDSPLSVDNQRQDIVTFISFADSSALAQQAHPTRVTTGGMDMLVNVDIEDNVHATVNLSDNGNDRIELIGGGNLTYTMNNQGDMRLTGRYSLTGGTVVYNPPIPMIAQKFFSIVEGSFVQWTGEALNPDLNITAVETIRTIIDFDDDRETVNFNITVIISGTLEQMNITFDLDAPESFRIKYDLLSMTAEQRASQAISLLLYNIYTGPSATTVRTGINANNAISSFLTQEINQWARNSLPGIDLSLGFESEQYNGDTHNNYTYQVSKRLFNDRVKVTVGGSVRDNANVQSNLSESFIQDFMLEYRLTKRDNVFLKFYRLSTFDMLEGEIIETGGGFLLRKRLETLNDLFRFTRTEEQKAEREQRRSYRDSLRNEERQIMRDTSRRRGGNSPEDSVRRAEWRARRDSMMRDSTYRPAPRDPSRFDLPSADSLDAYPYRRQRQDSSAVNTRRNGEALKEED